MMILAVLFMMTGYPLPVGDKKIEDEAKQPKYGMRKK